jgi:hypothetical protein
VSIYHSGFRGPILMFRISVQDYLKFRIELCSSSFATGEQFTLVVSSPFELGFVCVEIQLG